MHVSFEHNGLGRQPGTPPDGTMVASSHGILQEFLMTPRARFLVGACSLEADVVKKLVGLVVDDDQIANTFAYLR